HDVGFVPKVEQAQARLQDAYVGLAAHGDDLSFLGATNKLPNLLFLGQIKEILLEGPARTGNVLPDLCGKAALVLDRALERYEDWNFEIIEQARKVLDVLFQHRLERWLHLGQEELLNVNYHA